MIKFSHRRELGDLCSIGCSNRNPRPGVGIKQVAKGDIGEEWDGVRNYQARNFMRAMKIGDRGFFYHSQKEKSVVGIVEVIAEAHPDSTTDDDRSGVRRYQSCQFS